MNGAKCQVSGSKWEEKQVQGSRFSVQLSGRIKCIAANGTVMTQFPFNRRADKQSFPIRNSIVSDIVL
jgi:hypothetical protein